MAVLRAVPRSEAEIVMAISSAARTVPLSEHLLLGRASCPFPFYSSLASLRRGCHVAVAVEEVEQRVEYVFLGGLEPWGAD